MAYFQMLLPVGRKLHGESGEKVGQKKKECGGAPGPYGPE